MAWVRSLALNIVLYGWTAMLCILLLPGLLLPRRYFLCIVRGWLRQIEVLELAIGGIRYRVEGRENIPAGPCIIAAKHQSAWETFKLHLLFGDPAIVLKEELLRLPLWGWYAARAGMIPIDRGGGARTLTKMIAAAEKAVADGRKIVIFPQGTRIPPGAKKPYKGGVAKLYEALQVPVVPMALNSGLYWPKNSFLKRPGTITIRFLPPIMPGLNKAAMMHQLETSLEKETLNLIRK